MSMHSAESLTGRLRVSADIRGQTANERCAIRRKKSRLAAAIRQVRDSDVR